MKPRKELGQNFLINVGAARRIVDLLSLHPSEAVLEIGGGRGDLTVHLLATGARVITVEYDRDLVARLRERFADQSRLEIVQGDILRFDPAAVSGRECAAKLVGNLPYNITSAILEWIIERRRMFPELVVMVQKEVAARIVAKPGGKNFGSLTVFVQLFYTATRAFDLRPGSFFPAPKVSSSVVHLTRREQPLVSDADFPALRRLTAACFRWRRKQLLRILREEYQLTPEIADHLCRRVGAEPTQRPEQLAVTDFVVLAKDLSCLASNSSSSPLS